MNYTPDTTDGARYLVNAGACCKAHDSRLPYSYYSFTRNRWLTVTASHKIIPALNTLEEN